MPTPNYSYEKRQRELAKRQKKEQKLQKKLERKDIPGGDAPVTPVEGETAQTQADAQERGQNPSEAG